jgi:hypothetical protein
MKLRSPIATTSIKLEKKRESHKSK